MADTMSLEDLDDTKTTKACDALEEAFEKLRRAHDPQYFLLYFGDLFAQGLAWLDHNGYKQISDEILCETMYRIRKHCHDAKIAGIARLFNAEVLEAGKKRLAGEAHAASDRGAVPAKIAHSRAHHR